MNLGNLALSLPIAPNVPACVEWAKRAEDLGYESVWIAETGGPDVTSHEDDPPRFSRDDPGPETVLAIARVE